MPAAKNSKDLLATTKVELQRLQETIQDVDEKSSSWTSSEDNSSIKQIIAHRTEWMKMFFVWYQDGVDGKEPQVPAPGYKWNQLKEYNAMIWERDKQKSWNEIKKDFDKQSAKLVKFIEERDDKELYKNGLYEWTNTWTLGRYCESSGSSHYRSANKYIKKIIKENRE